MAATTYEIRLYDTPLVRLSWQVDELGQTHTQTVWADADKVHLLPPSLMLDQGPERIEAWLASRVIPESRAFADVILASCGLGVGDTKGIIDVCHGLSANDAFWVVPEGFVGSWHEHNLYENQLDAVLARVAYTGTGAGQRYKAGLSAEWTCDGTYPKAWRRIGDNLVLFKGPNPLCEGTANPDLGVWSEYFAAQVAEALEVPHVDYRIEAWEGKIASTCPLANDSDTALVPYHLAAGNTGYVNVVNTYARLGQVWLEAALDMFMFDAIIANTDRHAANHSVLRDNHSGAWIGPAPLFDHNLSLFPMDMPSDHDTWPHVPDGLMRRPAGARISFDTVMCQVCTHKHHAWGRRLLDLKLRNHERYPLDESRVHALERFLHVQGRRILEKTPHTLESVADLFARQGGDTPRIACPLLSGDIMNRD